MRRGPRIALVGFALAMAIVVALVAFWTPPQGDDWSQWLWAARHRELGSGRWLVTFLASHAAFSRLASYALARSHALHVVISPIVHVALVFGIYVVSTRRLPGASWDDVLGIVLASALLWVCGERIGQTLFHRTYVASDVYGATLAVWLLAAYRTGWRAPRWAIVPLVLAAYGAGTSTRMIAMGALAGAMVTMRALPRERRAPWMRWTLVALVVSTIAGFAIPPWIQVGVFLRHGWDANLLHLESILEITGVPIVALAILAAIDRLLAAAGRTHAPPEDAPDPREALGWLAAWCALALGALLGPRFTDAMLLPASIALVLACLPYARWLARGRALRRVISVTAAAVIVLAWGHSLAVYRAHGLEAQERFARIARGQPGQIVAVEPYRELLPTAWLSGEDWGAASLRQTVAIELYGLEDIELSPWFRRLEVNPGISVRLELDGVSDEVRRSAGEPAVWGTELSVARHQFELFMRRLRDRGVAPTARLVVTNVDPSAFGGRLLLAAWADHGRVFSPRVAHFLGDANDRYTVTIRPPQAAQLDEAWAMHGDAVDRIAYARGTMRVQPSRRERYVLVACDASRCFAADAFWPRF